MKFKIEFVKKQLDTLETFIKEDESDLSGVQTKKGFFKSIQAVDEDDHSWEPISNKEFWGGRDLFQWFRIVLTHLDINKEIIIELKTDTKKWNAVNPQFLVYLNGEIKQALDTNHTSIILKKNEISSRGGECQLDFSGWSGMEDGQSIFSLSSYTRNTQAFSCYQTLYMIYDYLMGLDPNDPNRVLIGDKAIQACKLLDFRTDRELNCSSFEKCDSFLRREILDAYKNELGYVAGCVGHTHIDIAWLWEIHHTREKAARSFATVLELMDQYPDYKFMSSQPLLYEFVKQDYPKLYSRIKEKVKEGRWEVEGGMWVEADCNLISGESFVRQFLYGKKFIRDEFGIESEILWLPDVFGYNASMPQILRKSGIKYFMTSKISWNQYNHIPVDTFNWKGIDGTEILTHFITMGNRGEGEKWTLNPFLSTYNGILEPTPVMLGLSMYQQKDINKEILVSFGYGDGGGGPTEQMLEQAERMKNGLPGLPSVVQTHSREYFDRLEKTLNESKAIPRWDGELYLEYHRGTYTSMARNKSFNRKMEFLLQDLEKLYCLLGEFENYPKDLIDKHWKTVLTNQFHDILPGSSIKEVYDRTDREYLEVQKFATNQISEVTDKIISQMTLDNESLVVFNTTGFKRDDIVKFKSEQPLDHVIDSNGETSKAQYLGSNTYLAFVRNIPANGFSVFRLNHLEGNTDDVAVCSINEYAYENEYYSLRFDYNGNMNSLFYKNANREVVQEGSFFNQLIAFEDKPLAHDNWDIEEYYEYKSWDLTDCESFELINSGKVFDKIKIKRKYMNSEIVQEITFYHDSPRIDVFSTIDWKEKDILLKVAFPVDILADKATFDIPFGNLERTTHRNTSWQQAMFEVPFQKWVDISEHDFGFAVLNDSKYGCDVQNGCIRQTLIKSGTYPNTEADKEVHTFSYSMLPHVGSWRESGVETQAWFVNKALYSKGASSKKSNVFKANYLLNANSDNVTIDTIKVSEDGNYIVIRVFETWKSRRVVSFTYNKVITELYESNLMEETIGSLEFDGHNFSVEFKPLEIKTFKIKI
ncbi:alpha-mannosidase [Oceanispirochaeta crateris]|uniref:Alpha-mannosidase n=1 Tax=Oceanispirochaeta crateris TaxID=2518645 RepID=A0A5C1QGP2_9SPIO|nr:alpha-mannosidase [Oceanispirochaeta crateris]QEN06721.1 alpha-mannosidase [Oceanispirochaeta crateris]